MNGTVQAVAQHMAASLAKWLDARCKPPVLLLVELIEGLGRLNPELCLSGFRKIMGQVT